MDRRLLLPLALALAAMAAAPARAENWFAFFMAPSGVAYLDRDSVILRPGHVTARLQSAFPQAQRLQRGGQVFVYSRARDTIDVDCRARVYRYVARDLYDNLGVEQLSVNEADNPILIQDETPPAALAAAYCPKPSR